MGVRISHDRYGIPAKLDDAAVHGGGSGVAGIDAAVIRDTCVVPATRRVERVGVAEVEAMIAMLAAIEPG